MYSNCCCDYSDDEDYWCNVPRVKGRFGLAFVAETPCCCPQPTGWQVEFCDSPSEVEQACQDMIRWANRPPLPRIEPCPPVEVISPCCPPKCNPYYPNSGACCSRYDCGYYQGCSCSQSRNISRCDNNKKRLRGGATNRCDAYDEFPVKEKINNKRYEFDSSESTPTSLSREEATFQENIRNKRCDKKKINKSKEDQPKSEINKSQNYTQTQNTDFQVYHERDFIQLQPPPYQPIEPVEIPQSTSDINSDQLENCFDTKISETVVSPFLYCNQPPPYVDDDPNQNIFVETKKCLSTNFYVTDIPPFKLPSKQFSKFKSNECSVGKIDKEDSKCTNISTGDEEESKNLTSKSSQKKNVSELSKKSQKTNSSLFKSKHTLSTSRTHQINNSEIKDFTQSKSKTNTDSQGQNELDELQNLEKISSVDLLTYFRGKNNFESVTSTEAILSELINVGDGKINKISSKDSSNKYKKCSKSSNSDKIKDFRKCQENAKLHAEEGKDKKENGYKLAKSCRSPRDYRKYEAVEIEGFSDADSNNDKKKRWSFDFFRSLTKKLGDIFKNVESDTDTLTEPVIYIDGVRFRVPPNIQKE